ncbi:hypothetical protein B7486_04605 [cyanobacterium TDX16]|nr:hypothetical protein B7486_04605 [cyanobacterium TDX16]
MKRRLAVPTQDNPRADRVAFEESASRKWCAANVLVRIFFLWKTVNKWLGGGGAVCFPHRDLNLRNLGPKGQIGVSAGL